MSSPLLHLDADTSIKALHYSSHCGIILAAQSSWNLSSLITALDCLLIETQAADWNGQVGWLNQWRR